MPIHDWSRVQAGIYHHFHTIWIAELSNALNGGMLPPDHYALAEQHMGRRIADVLTLNAPVPLGPLSHAAPSGAGGVAVAEAPPRVSRTVVVRPGPRRARRTLAIRHVSGHRLVALIEVLSPANKASPQAVAEFVRKAEGAIRTRVHLALLDLFMPGPHDPMGMHGALMEALEGEEDEEAEAPLDKPLTLAAFSAGLAPIAYLEHCRLGDPLPEMPLFLTEDRYVNLPLEPTYQAAYKGFPAFWRGVLETEPPPAVDSISP